MSVRALVESLARRGIELWPDPNSCGAIMVRPSSRLTDDDRQTIRVHKTALLAALAERDRDPEPAFPSPWPLDLVAIADAIAHEPRGPFENDLALSRAARTAVEAERIIRALPAAACREALSLCGAVSRDAVTAICARNYRASYDLLDNLPQRLQA